MSMWRLAVAVALARPGGCQPYTNVIVSGDDKVVIQKDVSESPALPMGTSVDFFGEASMFPLDGVIVVGGSLDLTVTQSDSFSKSLDMRQSAVMFALWLNAQRGGLRVGGKRFGLWTLWVDDKDSKLQVTNATAWSFRNKIMPAHFAVGGAAGALSKYALMQARADNKIMMVVGSSLEGTITKGDVGFGLLPDGDVRARECFASVVARAKMLDANASLTYPCGGRAGCVAQLTYGSYGSCSNATYDLARTFFPPDIFTEASVSQATDVRAALLRLQGAKVTVLHMCNLATDELKFVTEQMSDMNFNVFAIIAWSTGSTSEFRNKLYAGWWQGGYILDTVPWTRVDPSPRRGQFSNLTSREFASKYYDLFRSSPSYYAAAQYAALCALSAAIEDANSTNTSAVRVSLQNMKMQEFFGLLDFSSNQLNITHLIIQFNPNSPTDPEKIVHPPHLSTDEFVFPSPPWRQMRCRYETRFQVLDNECSGRGTCDEEGVCQCKQGWGGTRCNELYLKSVGSSGDEEPWLVPVSAGGAGLLGSCAIFAIGFCYVKSRRKKLEQLYCESLEKGIRDENRDVLREAREGLMAIGWLSRQVEEHERVTRRRESEEAGVSVAYLLSSEFMKLARDRSRKEDPTFYDLRDVIFFGDSPLGADITCPRDGRLGCSLLDSLERRHRGKCTHFMSWTWAYKLSTLVSALANWVANDRLDSSQVFIYMCFFVNNQYRILVSGETTGSEDLERCFEKNLRRIGKAVAVLDTWDNPIYLTRLWTIYEQVVAIEAKIPVRIVLPEKAKRSLFEQIEMGKPGLLRVKDALTKVSVQSAKATCPADQKNLKGLIERFSDVDETIVRSMIHWMGCEVQAHMKDLVKGILNDS